MRRLAQILLSSPRGIILLGILLVGAQVPLLKAALGVRRDGNGGAAVYAFPWWNGVVIMLGPLVLIATGVALLRIGQRWASACFLALALVGGAIVIPPFFLDRLMVDPDHVEQSSGGLIGPRPYHVRFDEVRALRRRISGRDPKQNTPYYNVDFFLKSGEVVTTPLGNLLEAAWPEVVARARGRGVLVSPG